MRLRLTPLLVLLLLPVIVQAKMQLLDQIVAVVNDNAITQSQLDTRLDTIKQRLSHANKQLPPNNILQHQVLHQMIINKIQLQLAEQAGIKVDDTSLHKALVHIAKQKNLTLQQFADKIRSQGINWTNFREKIRRQVTINELQRAAVSKKVHVSKREIDQFMKSAMASKLFSYDLHLAHIIIAVPSKASTDTLAAAKKKADALEKKLSHGANFSQMAIRYSSAPDALKGGDLGWRPASQLPTLYTKASSDLSPGQVSKPLKAGNGFHIIKLIGRRGNSGKKMVKQYKVRHILIKPDALHTPAQSKALAKKLRSEVVAGKSFAKLAKQYSDDPGSASQGGELGWVNPTQMVPTFRQVMTHSPKGKISAVFHTQYGWHFLEVEGTRNADISQKYRRMQAANALHQRYFEEQLQLWLQKIRSEAYVDIRLK